LNFAFAQTELSSSYPQWCCLTKSSWVVSSVFFRQPSTVIQRLTSETEKDTDGHDKSEEQLEEYFEAVRW